MGGQTRLDARLEVIEEGIVELLKRTQAVEHHHVMEAAAAEKTRSLDALDARIRYMLDKFDSLFWGSQTLGDVAHVDKHLEFEAAPFVSACTSTTRQFHVADVADDAKVQSGEESNPPYSIVSAGGRGSVGDVSRSISSRPTTTTTSKVPDDY